MAVVPQVPPVFVQVCFDALQAPPVLLKLSFVGLDLGLAGVVGPVCGQLLLVELDLLLRLGQVLPVLLDIPLVVLNVAVGTAGSGCGRIVGLGERGCAECDAGRQDPMELTHLAPPRVS
jgi:hypothetical protein